MKPMWALGPGVVEFPDGRRLRGRGLRRPLPEGELPEYGLYLLTHDPGPFPWPYDWIQWPDFRLPSDRPVAVDLLRATFERARDERVEVACGGGTGRTGTALAIMSTLAGIEPVDSVRWIRANYHHRAVETPWQRRWVSDCQLLS